MKQSTKSQAMAIKTVGEAGVFEGYASTFDVIDQGGDIVVKGAYQRTLQDRGAKGIKLLNEHCPSEPIGIWEELHEDDVGLFARGRLLIDVVPKARERYELMKAGVVDGLSIGYRVITSARDTSQGARLLQEVDLREISVVTFPMNETSLITSVKGELPTEREFERWLMQDAGFTRSQARMIITTGFKSLPNVKPGADDGRESSGGINWDAFSARLASLIEPQS